MNSIFEKDLRGDMVSPNDNDYNELIASSVVTKDIPAMTIVAWNPVRIIKKIKTINTNNDEEQ